MSKILLTLDAGIAGGVETFSNHLSQVFPDLRIIDFHMSKGNFLSNIKFPPLNEPLKAYTVDKYFMHFYKCFEPEVIFTNGMYGWHLDPKSVKTPILNISHGGWAAFADYAVKRSSLNYFRLRYIYGYFERLSLKNATSRVSNSEFTRRHIRRYYGLNSKVVYNAVNTEVFNPLPKEEAREILDLPVEDKIGLFVGPPSYSKGFDIVLKLSQLHGDISFLCVVNIPIGVRRKNLIVITNIPQTKLAIYYSAADFLIFPSRYEGFGYVPLEALACNTPIVASKTGILADINPPGSWIIEGDNYKSYSIAIKEALNTKMLWETKHFVEKNFSLEKFKKAYIEVVKEIL
jgi:glycosyltransferase involved in cell wall biosynthesis